MNSTELHLHTHYSLLDGLNKPEEYMERAKELGMTHIACTDHGNNAVHREWQKAAKAAGIKPILGQEMYFSATDRFDRRSVAKRDDDTKVFNHLIVLAMNEVGLDNLNRLSEIAWTEGFYSKPRIDIDVLEEYNEGLIILSGCKGGVISHAIENHLPTLANQWTAEFKRIFDDRFFMEIQSHNSFELNSGLLELAKKHGVEPVVTSDCHHARKEDIWREDAFLILSTKPDYGKDFNFTKSRSMKDMLERLEYAYPERSMSFKDFELFLHGADDHRKAFDPSLGSDVIDRAIVNTNVVASMIGDYPYHEGLDLLPRPKTDDPDALLEKKAWSGLRNKKLDADSVYVDRLREELDIIKAKDFSTYFLIEANAVAWGKSKGIRFGPGRGSGVGSLLNYCLGITAVDPVKNNLLFFRFINPERNDYPDIDTDIEDKRRSELKEYLRRQYKHVASISTYGTFAGKKSVRDAARVFRVPLGEVNRALKGADYPPNVDFFKAWESHEKGREFRIKYPEVTSLAKFLQGRIREHGMHAGGIVISKEPISNYAPMQTAVDSSDEAKNRIPLVALDMDAAQEVGFIKYDFLGLKALSVITDTVNAVKERHGVDLDMESLPLDNAEVFNTLSEGWTKGVFQCEQSPYTNLLINMGGVKDFDELVASNALVRPGAMDSTAGQSFIERKQGREMVEYPHPDMVPFTKETYGAVIYQEQVMLTMTELAGMSMSDADKVRKIIGKKRDVTEFEEYKVKFIEGASQKISKTVADRLWHDFEAHANYSFNKSHAYAYSLLSYWTAWLKQEYPLEFMWAALSNEGDKDQLLDYLTETKRLGIRVKLPHVNRSDVQFSLGEDEAGHFIRFGLANIKFISKTVGNRLIRERPFGSYNQLYETVKAKNSGLSSRCLQGMNAIGAATFPDNPLTGHERDNFYEYLNIPAFETREIPPKVRLQFRDLDEFSDKDSFLCMGMVRKIKTGEGWSRIDMVDETGTAGVFAGEHHQIETGNLYVFLISNNSIMRYIRVDQFDPDADDDFTQFLVAESFPDVPEGMHKVIGFRPRDTKAGKKMANMVVCDEHKNLTSVLVFPTMYVRGYSKCREGTVVDIVLKETKDGTLFLDNVL